MTVLQVIEVVVVLSFAFGLFVAFGLVMAHRWHLAIVRRTRIEERHRFDAIIASAMIVSCDAGTADWRSGYGQGVSAVMKGMSRYREADGWAPTLPDAGAAACRIEA